MHEIFFLVTALVGIGLLGYLITIITPQLFLSIGLFMLAAGLAEGIPTGFWYHVVLRRILIERGNLPHQSHPPAPGAFSPARPEPAETGSWPVGRAPSRGGFCSSRLCAFSTITIAASTMAPMAIAIPPSDMMFEVTFRYAIGMKDSRTATGRIRITTKALRK